MIFVLWSYLTLLGSSDQCFTRKECEKIFTSSGGDFLTNGRLQVDLFCHFKKSVNLPSYKLDTVASFYIGDKVKNYEYLENDEVQIFSDNLMGLKNGHYIKFEIINHSTDVYDDGRKFIIYDLENVKFEKLSETTIIISVRNL